MVFANSRDCFVREHQSYFALDSRSYNNIASIEQCKILCEANAVPSRLGKPAWLIDHCFPGFRCSGLSYWTLVRRCILYGSAQRLVAAPFVTSINVHCPRLGQAFAQYDFRLECLGLSPETEGIEIVYANASNGVVPAPTMPPMPKLAPLNLSSSVAIRDYYNELSTRYGLSRQVWYQALLGVTGFSDLVWGVPHDVPDWRYCYLLCASASSTCRLWTFVIDAKLDSQSGGCFLSTAVGIMVTLAKDEALSVSGTLERRYAADFGDQLIQDFAQYRQQSERGLTAFDCGHRETCAAYGKFLHIPTSPIVHSKVLLTFQDASCAQCIRRCNELEDCIALQWIPAGFAQDLASVMVDRTNCWLLEETGAAGVEAHPFVLSMTKSRMCNTEVEYLSNDFNIAPTKRFVTPEGFGDGVSVRGELISPPNIVMGSPSASHCEKICQGISECQYFTWGDWGACALYATANDFRRDAQGSVISGAREQTQELDWSLLVTNKFSHTETRGEHEMRLLETCANVEYDVDRKASLSGSLIAENVTSAQSCFDLCRSTKDCMSMTHHRLARRCVLHFESTMRVVQPGGVFTSAKSLCDAKGDMELLVLDRPTLVTPIVLGGVFVSVMASLVLVLATCLCCRRGRKVEVLPTLVETTAKSVSLCVLKSLTPKHQ